MNASFDQQSGQTPSPATGSRQATHNVGSAMSSAIRAAWETTPWQARHALRSGWAMERDGDASASMEREASAGLSWAQALIRGSLNLAPLAGRGRRASLDARR